MMSWERRYSLGSLPWVSGIRNYLLVNGSKMLTQRGDYIKTGFIVMAVTAWVLTTVFDPHQAWAKGSVIMSSEPICQSNSNILLCDDFEDGTWWNNNDRDGWSLPNYNPPDNATCGGVGAGGTICAADMGNRCGTGGQWGDHNLRESVTEVWVRAYFWKSPGYKFRNEKILILEGVAGQFLRCRSSEFSSQKFDCSSPHLDQNQGVDWRWSDQPLGNWILFEWHVVLNTPGQSDGLLEVWIDDCGPSGTTCPATQTLRMRHNAIQFPESGSMIYIKFEHWSNAPGSCGRTRFDQVVVSKTGPIGPMATGPDTTDPTISITSPLRAPSNLEVK